ncbi:uncharacterized protein VTP21DRAFT_10804 [Calcarisporiella thermophila]|uniref:uncharacterized protein n=1 Tax=Calcarisporiella thermophila TaxID=911321 RepID=UPI003742123D
MHLLKLVANVVVVLTLQQIVSASPRPVLDHEKRQTKTIPEGEQCSSIAGPIGKCAKGVCCNVFPDVGLCYAGTKCPEKFIPEGGLCSGIAGPSPYPCWPGTKCCNLGPDRSVCARRC